MFKKIREKRYIKEVRKAMGLHPAIKYIALNTIKDRAAKDLIMGRITIEFFEKVFTGTIRSKGLHFSEVNKEYIENY